MRLANDRYVEINLLKHKDLIAKTVRRYTRNFRYCRYHSDFDDFFQEGMIAAWRAIESHHDGEGRASLTAYIHQCIKNRMYDLNRKAYRKCRSDEFSFDELREELGDSLEASNVFTTYGLRHSRPRRAECKAI
jgi:RNA polymerase sigma factor (sigma-70 family)